MLPYNKNRKLLASSLSLMFGMGAVPMASVAQDKPRLEEVRVTAQKREQGLREVPSTVNVVSAEMLSKSNVAEFTDLTKITSGVELSGLSDGFSRTVRIRGVGIGVHSLAVDPSVGIFLDEVPLVDAAAAFNNLVDIEQIEVLKGPQSTLFGKSVSSGAITLTTKAPNTDAAEAYIEGNFGSLNLRDVYLGGNLPLSDNAAVRASIYDSQIDGTMTNIVTGNDLSPYEKRGGRFRAMWEPSEDLSITLAYEYHKAEATGIDHMTLEYGDLQETLAALDPSVTLLRADPSQRLTQTIDEVERETETKVGSLKISWDLNEHWSMTSITAQQSWVQDPASRWTSTTPFPIGPENSVFDRESFSQELRFTYSGERWDSIIGIYYGDAEQDSHSDLSLALAIVAPGQFAPGFPAETTFIRTSLSVQTNVKTEDRAIFTHNTVSFDSGWDIVFGLRYSEVEKDALNGQRQGAGEFASLHGTDPVNPVLNSFIPLPVSTWEVPKQSKSWDAITGGLKFVYAINDAVSAYIGYDRGFKPGGFNSVQDDGTGQGYRISKPFDEELADNYEIGLKGLFFDSRVMANVAVFRQEYEDYQVSIPDPVSVIRFENASSIEVEGVEIEWEWAASESVDIGGSASYINARYDKYTNAGCVRPQYGVIACGDDQLQDLSGKPLHLNSPFTAFAYITWSGAFNNGMDWYLRGEASYRDKKTYLADLDPASEADDYSLFNASAGISRDKWSVVLWAKNIFDEDYIVDIADGFDGSNVNFLPTARIGLRGRVGMERTYGIRLKYAM